MYTSYVYKIKETFRNNEIRFIGEDVYDYDII